MEMRDDAIPVYAVLLAGGSGTRLWPVSRELFPKQLVNFFGNQSLLQHTVERLSPLIDSDCFRIVCGQEHYYEVERHMANIGLPPAGMILAEPCGRNTAPAILLALLDIMQKVGDAVICIFPADHVIKDNAGFHDKLRSAVCLAQQGFVVTFGIRADYPETGYGYIEGGDAVQDSALRIARFVEKPDRKTAEGYLAAGNYFWNSGMFAFKASVMRSEFETHQPALIQALERLIAEPGGLTADGYGELTNISIDYAIMENTDKGVVLPSGFGWSDIGTWKSLFDFLPKDENNNVLDGDVIAENTRNSFIMGYHRLVAVNALDNLVVIDTPDSVFVSDIGASRDVKTIVGQLKRIGREEYHHHRMVHHKWGAVTLLAKGATHDVEQRIVYPSRSCGIESANAAGVCNLTVVEGDASITTTQGHRKLSAGESMTIKDEDGVRVENIGKTDLQIILTRISDINTGEIT
ncbi:MAG: mannose-1-phosphate guanylyltransferase/mannose-6-phosphate isomerase [Deltaproteobacteria bacterium]|nr:mannose-1-phosphate guanylyltransferase/mannose-6-phosphate isomerase [Deltaproteobacteria bacterium]